MLIALFLYFLIAAFHSAPQVGVPAGVGSDWIGRAAARPDGDAAAADEAQPAVVEVVRVEIVDHLLQTRRRP